jgi:hypothetical protein
MRPFSLLFVVLIAGFVISCHKTNPAITPGNPNDSTGTGNGGGTKGGSLAFANGDYVGVMTELSRYFQKPIDVHFNADSTVWAYCLFNLRVNNAWLYADSLEGKVIRVGTGNAGGPSATVYFAAIADTQVYNFSTDLSAVTGGSNGLAGNQFYFSDLQKAPLTAFVLNPSFWRANGPYPDIDGLQFTTYAYDGTITGNVTEFFENGNWLNTGPEGIPPGAPYAFPYLQIGSRVYFDGYESASPGPFIGLPYFGVLTPDGGTIMADSRSTAASLPTDPTENGYGNTPTMVKKSMPSQQACLISSFQYGVEKVTLAYNSDKSLHEMQEIQPDSLDVQYQYTEDSVVMVTSANNVAMGRVVLTNGASGLTTNMKAYGLNTDGSVAGWWNYAYTYSGLQVSKVQQTSSRSSYYSDGEYDYVYSGGNLQSISFQQHAFMTFTYDNLTPAVPGDLFWQEAVVDLPFSYQEPTTWSSFLCGVSNINVCTGINTVVASYVYDNTGKITSAMINDVPVTYQYNCPN